MPFASKPKHHGIASWDNTLSMRPQPPPHVPGHTEAERMDAAVRKMFSVSKEDVLKEEAREKQSKHAKKRAKSKDHQG